MRRLSRVIADNIDLAMIRLYHGQAAIFKFSAFSPLMQRLVALPVAFRFGVTLLLWLVTTYEVATSVFSPSAVAAVLSSLAFLDILSLGCLFMTSSGGFQLPIPREMDLDSHAAVCQAHYNCARLPTAVRPVNRSEVISMRSMRTMCALLGLITFVGGYATVWEQASLGLQQPDGVDSCAGNQVWYLVNLLAWTAFNSVVTLVALDCSLRTLQENSLSITRQGIVCLACLLFSLSLATYSIETLASLFWRVMHNVTAYELQNSRRLLYMKMLRTDQVTPWDAGWITNLKEFLGLGGKDWAHDHSYTIFDVPNHPLQAKFAKKLRKLRAKAQEAEIQGSVLSFDDRLTLKLSEDIVLPSDDSV